MDLIASQTFFCSAFWLKSLGANSFFNVSFNFSWFSNIIGDNFGGESGCFIDSLKEPCALKIGEFLTLIVEDLLNDLIIGGD